MPVALAGEADVDMRHRPSARPRFPAHRVRADGDGRARSWIGDAGTHAHQRDRLVRAIGVSV